MTIFLPILTSFSQQFTYQIIIYFLENLVHNTQIMLKSSSYSNIFNTQEATFSQIIESQAEFITIEIREAS